MRYIDRIKTIPDYEPNDPLLLGTALHTGLEHGVQTAVEQYYMSFPAINDLHINEAIKLEALIPKVKLPQGKHEVKISTPNFIGYIDLLVPVGNVQFDIYDFKYSNNIEHYKESRQLHLYKHYCNENIRNMYFLFVPKTGIRKKKTEDIYQFRQRLYDWLETARIKQVEIPYDPSKVEEFHEIAERMINATEFPKNSTRLCDFCEYKLFCKENVNYMLLPSNERRNIEKVTKRVVWLYGAPFSGKTTFANKFPDPLMLNTDGNIRFVDSPYIAIKDEVTVEGRSTKRKFAWEVFKDAIAELEKKENDFKTIIVDLLEDTYEHCRLYMYDQLGITHESDDSFRAWDKVRIEFLSTLKRLMNLDYHNIILISHEDTTKDITKKSGDRITAIKPNLNEKASNKVAGMVDIVGRVTADGEKRILAFKSDEVIFGGGRLTTTATTIPLDYDEFIKVYAGAVTDEKPKRKEKPTDEEKPRQRKRRAE